MTRWTRSSTDQEMKSEQRSMQKVSIEMME